MPDSFDELIDLALQQARIATALPEGEDDAAWHTYHQYRQALQAHASTEGWERIAALAGNSEAVARSLVPNVLRYFGRIRVDETVELLRHMVAAEADETVIRDIGLAFIELNRPDAARELMLPFSKHASAQVRVAVAHALGFSQHPDAVATMIALSSDPDAEVRNWATFHLGACEPDDASFNDPAVHAALAARLDDADSETRAEAVEGLARRGDRVVLPVLKRELEAGAEWGHYLVAASSLPTPDLIPALEALQASNVDREWKSMLDDALAACRATQQSHD